MYQTLSVVNWDAGPTGWGESDGFDFWRLNAPLTQGADYRQEHAFIVAFNLRPNISLDFLIVTKYKF